MSPGVAAMRQMAAADAQMLWLSSVFPNDQFLVFAFDGAVSDVAGAVAALRRRAEGCPELSLRVADDRPWRYPRWEPVAIADEQFAVHGEGDWPACLDALVGMAQLDARRMCWRAHVFPKVADVPAVRLGSVVVVQIVHALGDGTRSAALAGVLLGRAQRPRPVRPDRGFLPWRAVAAARAHRQLERDIESGVIEPGVPPRPALDTNAGPRGAAAVRTLAVDRRRLPGPTVTVGALVIIAEALGGYLGQRDRDISALTAEVPMARADGGVATAHNTFRNVAVSLHPELGRTARAARIGDQLRAQRQRAEHPATRAADAAFAAMPAALLRWGTSLTDPQARSETVNGHTVVSSVNRGPADLTFGGRRVVLTAGFPALSPMMGLTHGVHGIGDRVALSVHADPAVIDVDDYLDRLQRALRR